MLRRHKEALLALAITVAIALLFLGWLCDRAPVHTGVPATRTMATPREDVTPAPLVTLGTVTLAAPPPKPKPTAKPRASRRTAPSATALPLVDLSSSSTGPAVDLR